MPGRILLGAANPSLDANGNPVAGSTLTFYALDATTPQSVYDDEDLMTPLANPLTCDAGGLFPVIWAQSNVGYYVKWSRPGMADVTFDNIFPTGGPAPISNFTILTAASGTYNTPAGARQLRIRMIGSGASGSSTNATVGPTGVINGTAGQNSVFNGIVATGGSAGIGLLSGGSTLPGAGTATFRRNGAGGQPGAPDSATGARGGSGGNSAFGGAGPGAPMTGGGANGGDACDGTGAGGGGSYDSGTGHSAPGGGAGEYIEIIIDSPAASYAYQVGQSVSATGGFTKSGGGGARGFIIVEALF